MSINPANNGPKMKAGTEVKVERAQQQVDDVTKIMEKNMKAAIERGERLDDLAEKTAALELGARGFAKNAHRASQQLWWKNLKYWAMLIGIIVILVMIFFYRQIYDVLSLTFSCFSSK